MNKKELVWIIIIGFLSGIITDTWGYAANLLGLGSFLNSLGSNTAYYSIFDFLSFYSPGIIFGIAISIFFLCFNQQKKWGVASFTIVSTFAYYAAVWIVLGPASKYLPVSYVSNSIDMASPPLFFIAGAVGALIVATGVKFLLRPISYKQIVLLAIWGGLLATTVSWLRPLITPYGCGGDFSSGCDPSFPPGFDTILYILWQTGIAFGIGICMLLRNKARKSF